MMALLRLVRVRSRFFVTAAIVLGVFLAGPGEWPAATRFLCGWVCGALVYLGWAWTRMIRASVQRMRERAKVEDEGATLFLAITIGAAAASVVAIVAEIQLGEQGSPAQTALVFGSLTLSWLVIHTDFTIHYAHMFYNDEAAKLLRFPDDPDEPLYSDFAYFSGTIGAALQTSDVAVASSAMRSLVLAHSVLSFAFNTAILALAINLAASG